MTVLIYLLFLLFSLGQLGRISFQGQQINVYLYELPLFVVLIYLFLRYKLVPIKGAFRKYKEIILFVGILVATYLLGLPFYNLSQNAISFLYLVRLIFYISAFLYLDWHFEKAPKETNKMLSPFLIFCSLTLLVASAQYFLYPDLRNLFYLGWDPHLYRAFGLFFDTTAASAIYGLILLFLVVNYKRLKLANPIKLVLVAAYSTLGLLTYSRGFYLAIIATFILYLLSKRKHLYILLLFLAFILSLFLLPKKFGEGVNLLRTFSVTSRLQDSKLAISIWQKKPLLGIGYNRIRYEKERLGVIKKNSEDVTHSGASFASSFLIVLVTGGIVGLVVFILTLFKLATISEGAKLEIIFVSIFSLSDNVLLHPFVFFLLLMMISLKKI